LTEELPGSLAISDGRVRLGHEEETFGLAIARRIPSHHSLELSDGPELRPLAPVTPSPEEHGVISEMVLRALC
jgi:hypothetical protein